MVKVWKSDVTESPICKFFEKSTCYIEYGKKASVY